MKSGVVGVKSEQWLNAMAKLASRWVYKQHASGGLVADQGTTPPPQMEALTAASLSLLTVWDMTKALGGKEMRIEGVMVVHKEGGKSGDWRREGWDDGDGWDL